MDEEGDVADAEAGDGGDFLVAEALLAFEDDGFALVGWKVSELLEQGGKRRGGGCIGSLDRPGDAFPADLVGGVVAGFAGGLGEFPAGGEEPGTEDGGAFAGEAGGRLAAEAQEGGAGGFAGEVEIAREREGVGDDGGFVRGEGGGDEGGGGVSG